jgi:hypothetical protein
MTAQGTVNPDGFDAALAAKIWALVPGYHRSLDASVLDGTGPLQALLTRVAGQAAEVRRSIDRLWEDQSIETCSDWVIPYIAALLDTNLVPAMDARGRRLDVANTIYYRRRKGTVPLLEQLASDVTGWEARVVEFFRTLARRRHLLDPPIGRPADTADPADALLLQRTSGLTGLLTGTPMGGYADLRNALGAGNTSGPYDEFRHRVDVRLGRGNTGWYGIPKIGVFLWRSADIAVPRATPIAVAGCPGQYSFDPTGRQTGLWQADSRPAEGYGERWTSLAQWQVPGPLTQPLYDAVAEAGQAPLPQNAYPDPHSTFWPGSLSVSPLGSATPLAQNTVTVWPEVGRFTVPGGTGDVEVSYHYGLFSRIGAGPFDRRQIGVAIPVDPVPATQVPGGSATALKDALAALAPTGTVIVTDGLTSTALSPVGSATVPVQAVSVRAADAGRAVIRLPVIRSAGQSTSFARNRPWVFTGTALKTSSGAPIEPTATLRLEGLLMSGVDVVLRGGFDCVTLSCCTLDPGTAGDLWSPVRIWQPAVDGRDLGSGQLKIEGTVKTLVLDRCIVGPVRVRSGGVVQNLCASNSVVQGLPIDAGGDLTIQSVFDPDGLLRLLNHKRDALTTWLAGKLTGTAATAVADHSDGASVSATNLTAVVGDLNAVLAAPLWDPALFADRTIPQSLITQATATAAPTGTALIALNRELLEAAFPVSLGQAALALDDGVVNLDRCTVLGRAFVHRLECSESILDDYTIVDDTQDGCVRFSAWAAGSSLPRKYESVTVEAGAPLFESRRFGEAGYAQLLDGVDAQITGGSTAAAPSIRTGAQNGSEMGVYCRDGAALKERSLLIKYQEYLPVGLAPVLIPMPPSDSGAEDLRGAQWPPT